ncbi:MAG: acetyl-CoA decarbonylase/synthase complex subunit gamma [Dehalococcoidia bacterium]|nr:acetyl-CoA decarbonylase/synthase complex subunit gamma [Dehalococcoidia bacterium]
MALTGIEIYKFLPKTNCKKCNFPTCLAFAMKVAQKTVDVSVCPDLSPESKAALEAAGRPPIRLVTIGPDAKKVEVGNETVLFRHEKTFFHPPALMVRIKDNEPLESIEKTVAEVSSYSVERVGIDMAPNGFAIDNLSKDAGTFAKVAASVAGKSELPLVLMSTDPAAMEAALEKVGGNRPLIYGANAENWEKMAQLAAKYKCALAVIGKDGLDSLSELTEKITKAGVEDLVLAPNTANLSDSINTLTQLRRLAFKKAFKPLGYPVITFPGAASKSVEEEAILAAQQIGKYAGIIVLDHFTPALFYPLLTLRLNIYTDPQKHIQVTSAIYPIGSPKETSPVCVTTNFSLTYFSVAGELESSGFPAWLLVCDTEGLSVLTAWAAGKFDAERIAKAVKTLNLAEKISHQKIILPGKVAVLRGELEDELKGWDIMIGPPEAMDIGSYLKQMWKN